VGFEKYFVSMILGLSDLENSWNGDSRPERFGKIFETVKQVRRALKVI
jgi:hypothetical protein